VQKTKLIPCITSNRRLRPITASSRGAVSGPPCARATSGARSREVLSVLGKDDRYWMRHGGLCARGEGRRLSVTVLDVSPWAIDQLRGKVDVALIGDVESLEIAGEYEIVVCAGVLDYVSDPAVASRTSAALSAGREIGHSRATGGDRGLTACTDRQIELRIACESVRPRLARPGSEALGAGTGPSPATSTHNLVALFAPKNRPAREATVG